MKTLFCYGFLFSLIPLQEGTSHGMAIGNTGGDTFMGVSAFYIFWSANKIGVRWRSFTYEVKEIKHLQITWQLQPVDSVLFKERYCKRCGKRTNFQDSSKKRRNGNGHQLYEYAIFKCERDHTWNKLIGIYDVADSSMVKRLNEWKDTDLVNHLPYEAQPIDVAGGQLEGIETLTITLVGGAVCVRIDQLLATILLSVSRSQIVKWIGEDRVFLDGGLCKKSDLVSGGQTIVLHP